MMSEEKTISPRMTRGALPGDIVLLGCGDVGPVHEPPDAYAELARPTLAAADIRFGQCERVYSERGAYQVQAGSHSRLPKHMASVFTSCGFDVVSLASNHAMDWGGEALLDTKALLEEKGIVTAGAGSNLQEARKPAIVERKGIKVGFLAYCSVLRPGYAATSKKPGCAPLRIHTYYEAEEYQPGLPPRVVTVPYEEDMEAVKEDIAAAKQKADVVALSLHWGLHEIPRAMADYQSLFAHAAFEAGADVILGHHAHLPKAVEVYKGKVCFHSLSNFIMSNPGPTTPEQVEERVRRLKGYGTELDPDYPHLPYGVDAKRSLVARVVLSRKGVGRVSFLPVLIDKQLRPEFLRQGDARFDDAVRYMEWCSEGYAHRFSIEGDEVVVMDS
ncbi:MAG: CapA family protein [Chloroflexota bacterium]